VGVGNEFRGDDGAGLAAARLLGELSSPEIEVIELDGEVTRLLDDLQDCEAAFLIDAVQPQGEPGTTYRFDASHQPLPGYHDHRSTHGMSLGSLLELARTQGFLPRHVIVYGIEAASSEHGAGLTPEVETAVHKIVREVHDELLALKSGEKGRASS